MKGFKDSSGKFRPTENKIGVRKSRDQSTKTQGVKLGSGTRMKRFLSEQDIDRLSDTQLNAIFKDVEKRWEGKTMEDSGREGDGFSMIYRNKNDPRYTFELHPLDDDVEYDESDEVSEEASHFNAWYFFPAKDKKGLINSPYTISETGGYKRKDAIKEFKKELIRYDQEFE